MKEGEHTLYWYSETLGKFQRNLFQKKQAAEMMASLQKYID